MAIYTMRVLEAVPPLGIYMDDLLVLNTNNAPPLNLVICRPSPVQPKTLVDLVARGFCEVVTPGATLCTVAAQLGCPLPEPRVLSLVGERRRAR